MIGCPSGHQKRANPRAKLKSANVLTSGGPKVAKGQCLGFETFYMCFIKVARRFSAGHFFSWSSFE